MGFSLSKFSSFFCTAIFLLLLTATSSLALEPSQELFQTICTEQSGDSNFCSSALFQNRLDTSIYDRCVQHTEQAICEVNFRARIAGFIQCVKSGVNIANCENNFLIEKPPAQTGGGTTTPNLSQGSSCDPTTGFCPAAGIIQVQELLTRIINLSTTLAFIAATIWLAWSSIKFFITSGGDPKALSQAWASVTWIFMGIVFMILAYLALKLIAAFSGFDVTDYCLGFPPYCIDNPIPYPNLPPTPSS